MDNNWRREDELWRKLMKKNCGNISKAIVIHKILFNFHFYLLHKYLFIFLSFYFEKEVRRLFKDKRKPLRGKELSFEKSDNNRWIMRLLWEWKQKFFLIFISNRQINATHFANHFDKFFFNRKTVLHTSRRFI